jgi:hypothetical protein
VLFCHTQAENDVKDLQDDKRQQPAPRNRRADAQPLHGGLLAHGHAIGKARATDARCNEHAGQHGSNCTAPHPVADRHVPR